MEKKFKIFQLIPKINGTVDTIMYTCLKFERQENTKNIAMISDLVKYLFSIERFKFASIL